MVRYTKMGFKNWERVAKVSTPPYTSFALVLIPNVKVVTDIYCGILRFLLFVYRLFKSKDGKDRGEYDSPSVLSILECLIPPQVWFP